MYPNELCRYVYIAAPISFLWINPIAFALLEIGTRKAGLRGVGGEGRSQSVVTLAWTIFKSVLANPVVFMTMLGTILNFVFGHMPPEVFLEPFELLSKTFGGLALTALGMSMANQLFYLKESALLSALCIIFAKTIIMPLMAKTIVGSMIIEDVYISSTGATPVCNASIALDDGSDCQAYDLGVFAFVYSTFPTAPGVLAFALQFGVDATEMAAATVLCTVVSAPLMFVTAQMAFVREFKEENSTGNAQETIDSASQVFNYGQ
jgi:predicted permease